MPGLWRELKRVGLPVICVDARHAHAVLSTARITTATQLTLVDLAELIMVGRYRGSASRSTEDSQAIRSLLVTGSRLVSILWDLENQGPCRGARFSRETQRNYIRDVGRFCDIPRAFTRYNDGGYRPLRVVHSEFGGRHRQPRQRRCRRHRFAPAWPSLQHARTLPPARDAVPSGSFQQMSPPRVMP